MYREHTEQTEGNDFNFNSEAQFQQEFGWYSMIYTAANEIFLNIDEVLKKPASEFLMYINFYVRKQELERERLEKISNRNDSRGN